MRIRAREQWTLRTLKGELNAYSAELYLQGPLPSTFFSSIFINYFTLIARIIKRRSGKGRRGSLESRTHACLGKQYVRVRRYTRLLRKEQGKKHKLNSRGQQGCRPSVADCAC